MPTRKTYTEEQKLAAVHRVVIGEESQTAVLRDMGLASSSTISKWVRQYGKQVRRLAATGAVPASAVLTATEDFSTVEACPNRLEAGPAPTPDPPLVARRSNRTGFAAEVKASAVRRLLAGERAIDLARELGVNPGTIYYWRDNLKGSGPRAIAGPAPPPTPKRGYVDTSIEASYARLKAAAEEAIICLEKAEKHVHERVYLRLIKEMDDAHVEAMNACRELRRALKKP